MSRVKSTKKYQALIAAGLDEAAALNVLGVAPAVTDDRLAGLLSAGFSQADAERILTAQFSTPVSLVKAPKDEPVEALTSKDKSDAQVAARGLAHGRGRVYLTGSIIEAAARVLKGGEPEVVTTSGVGRTTAVALFREDSGNVAAQNLYTPV